MAKPDSAAARATDAPSRSMSLARLKRLGRKDSWGPAAQFRIDCREMRATHAGAPGQFADTEGPTQAGQRLRLRVHLTSGPWGGGFSQALNLFIDRCRTALDRG